MNEVKDVSKLVLSGVFLFFSGYVLAVPFGAFDARSLAMGGAGVAAGNSESAAFFNPALMATFSIRKELGRNNRFVLPSATAKFAESAYTVEDIEDDEYEQQLTAAITAFNDSLTNTGTVTSQEARAVLDASRTLEDAVDDISDGPVQVDANVGLLLSIGHKFQGGAFIFNKRWVGDARVEDFESDIALLEEYVAAMEFIEGGGSPAAANALYPNVIDAGGNLIDQTNNLDSFATGSALEITELGMALAMTFNVFDRDIAFGITPKMIQVTTHSYIADATTGDSESIEDEFEDWDINLDFGVAHDIDPEWRVGAVIKNIRTLEYETSLGNKLKIEPQVRAGAQYRSPWGLYALDVDVLENEPVGNGSEFQVYSLGGEWKVARQWQLRAGFTKNLKGSGSSGDGLFSAGVHWDFGGVLDITFAQSDYERAYGLLLGTKF